MKWPPKLASVDKSRVQVRSGITLETNGSPIKNLVGNRNVLDWRATRYASVTVIGLIAQNALSSYINDVFYTGPELSAINIKALIA